MQAKLVKLGFVYLSAMLLFFLSACGPQPKQQLNTPGNLESIQYEGEIAKPTLTIPADGEKKSQAFQAPPKKILNNNKTEVILGSVELKDTKISYSSVTQKMLIIGHAVIKKENKDGSFSPVTEKDFSLSGTHKQNENSFILTDETESSESQKNQNNLRIKAEARCLSARENHDLDCNHVMVDIYFLHNEIYYTEQIEVNRIKPQANPAPAVSAPEEPVAPSESSQPESPQPEEPTKAEEIVQKETEDQIDIQQSEGSDESIEGRYQGGAETIDLVQLFSEPAPEPVKKEEPKKEPKKEPTDQVLSPQLIQTKNGDIRPINQASGFPDKGFLRNATSVLTRQKALAKKAFFEIVAPERNKHFATYEMAELISRVSGMLYRIYTKTLYISNLSAAHGGKLTPHLSHQNGLDADIGYPSDASDMKFPLVVRMKTQEYFAKNYSVEKTYQLFKYLFSQNDILVDRIFIDKKIKNDLCTYALNKNEFKTNDKAIVENMFSNLQHVDGHGDHFHLRIKCSKLDPACRGRVYKKIETCAN